LWTSISPWLRGVGVFDFTAQAVPKPIDITIAPMNDAPEIRDVYSVSVVGTDG